MPRWIYTLLLRSLLPLALVRLAWRAIRQPEYLRHIPERFGFYRVPRPRQPVIWLHAVSVGETRAAAPLVAELRRRYPGHCILLTHATPTGRAAGEQLFRDGVLRCYLPYDLPGAAARFLRHFRPSVGLLMETELWFNLIEACHRRGVPLLLVNARLSQKSARGYAKLGRLTAHGLKQLAGIAAQTAEDAARLRALGAQAVAVTGNLKFDVAPPPEAAALGQHLRQLFGAQRPVFLAASTREGEEALILDAVEQAAIPQLMTVIVPRHPQRFDEVAGLLQKRGLKFVRRSAGVPAGPDCTVALGDSMGEMFAYYAACDVAFVGGSLMPLGGQNLIEACAMGRPVLIGPHTFNFEAVAAGALQAGAALRVENAAALGERVHELFGDPAARERMSLRALAFSTEHRGATGRVLELIAPVLAGR